jgi:CYTH domain-containing protein
VADPVAIIDLYISGTRLRLRRTEKDGEVVYKLGQKVRPEPERPEVVKLTNIYLSEQEYSTLQSLGGAEIVKTRWRWSPDGAPMVVDEFGGRLAGLILAETELKPDEPRHPGPPQAVAEVTDDDRFSGGTLARTTAEEIEGLLTDLGLTAAPGRPSTLRP